MGSQLKSQTPDIHRLDLILRDCGIVLTEDQLEKFWRYHNLLRDHNAELGLTRIHNFENMVLKLYVDSLLPGQMVDLPSPLLDLGTGAGMPGIPLKIRHPNLDILLAESRRKRVGFLEKVVTGLRLENVQIVARSITEDFEQPVDGVICRAVESISETLKRIRGCLRQQGRVFFMKGPGCDPEIQEATQRFSKNFRLVRDLAYRIGSTSNQRRLVVFEHLGSPPAVLRAKSSVRHRVRTIESDQNQLFKDLKKLLSARGIKKQDRVLVSGPKTVAELIRNIPSRCLGWISSGDRIPPPPESPETLEWYRLAPALHDCLDIFGTRAPLLLFKPPEIGGWNVSDGFPKGCSLLLPFQDPENVGAAIRSAVAFGVSQVIVLAESAHPFHPKAVRASGGAVFSAHLYSGPSLSDLPRELPVVPLSTEGLPISKASFPDAFGLLPGIEGPGLPDPWRNRAVSIPIGPLVESLNAAAAVAIALYVWSQ